jgi:hypothetical protein
MQGHRHDHVGRQRIVAAVDDHQAGQGRSQATEAPVLERVHRLTQGTLKKRHRSYAVKGRSSLLTLTTELNVRRGRATKRTEWGQHELDLALALAAKQTASLMAIHTTRREEQRQQVSPDISRDGQNLHESPASQQRAFKRCLMS